MFLNSLFSCKRISFAIPMLLSVSLSFFSSCEDPSFVGLEIQPEADRFRVNQYEDTAVSSSVQQRDSLVASRHARSLLGEVDDPVFGNLKASFLTQVGVAGAGDFGVNAVVDSLVLYLNYTGHYGELPALQNISVYEVSELMDPDSVYYSNLDPGGIIYDQKVLAEQTINSSPGDSIIAVSLTNTEFQDKLINAPDSVMQSIGRFITFMKGLYVTAGSAGETGAVFPINLNNEYSRLSLFYRNAEFPDSSFRYDYVIQEGAQRINLFEHDYSSAVFYDESGLTVPTDSVFYLQGAGGVMSRLDFDQLHTWRDSVPVSINSAKLIFSLEEGDVTSEDFPPPIRLTVYQKNQDGELFGIVDIVLGDRFFDGNLDVETGEYSFNITNWVQDYISGENDDSSVYIAVRDAGSIPHRAVIRGSDHPQGGPRLDITYTKH